MSEIRFYIDENVDAVVASQLAKHGIDAVNVRDLGLLGDTDENHLQRAGKMGRVLVTHDTDFLSMANSGIEHTGIVFARHHKATPGSWVKALINLHARSSAEDMLNRVEFVQLK
ncbi:MAG: DUF5615 family PIN-like protein [Anaerolineae bacterium]|nr:DUF5615 family PIN-like protein [Anaerolineae bacterium]